MISANDDERHLRIRPNDFDALVMLMEKQDVRINAEQNSSNAKTESIIFLKERNIRSISEQKNQIHVLRSERNAL